MLYLYRLLREAILTQIFIAMIVLFSEILGQEKTGNSMSTAFVSGIFALAKSYNKGFTKEDIIKQLLGK